MAYFRTLIHYNSATGQHRLKGGLGDPLTIALDPRSAAIKALGYAGPQVRKTWILIQVVEQVIDRSQVGIKVSEFGDCHTFRPHHLENIDA